MSSGKAEADGRNMRSEGKSHSSRNSSAGHCSFVGVVPDG